MLYASILIVLFIIAMLTYALTTNGKIANMALVAFGCSLLAICFQLGGKMVSLLR